MDPSLCIIDFVEFIELGEFIDSLSKPKTSNKTDDKWILQNRVNRCFSFV